MPDKSPELYNLKKTTIFFAAASIILLASLIGMVMQDSIRDWKGYQKRFVDYSRHKAEEERAEVQKKIDQKKLDQLKADLVAAEKESALHSAEIKKIEHEISKLEIEARKARTDFQDIKQVQDSDRYFFEEHRAHGQTRETEKYRAQIKKRAAQLRSAKLNLEDREAQQEAKQKSLAEYTEKKKLIGKAIEQVNQDIIRLSKKIETLKPGIVKMILNAPMLDFLKPTLQIQQVVLEDLYDDFYFSKSKKVDRCITCHLGIDQKGFENASQPFETHPRLDLFLSSNSPHRLEEMGCTICHGGSGHSANFVTAAHTPRDKKQAAEWKKKYGWSELKHWGDKMLPLQHVEASCAKCHQGVVEVPQAPKLNEGRKVAETFGCLGCHKVEGMERWKVGPNLQHVQSKVEQDWIVRWLHNPKDFRPSTQMPRIFHQSNTSDPESVEKDNAAIAAIATYLTRQSTPVTLQKLPANGNAESGKTLIESVGCLGCHSAVGKNVNHHGPELSNLGSKVNPDWLFTWLKDPKHYSPQTRMPNLRLSDQEAADIATFLLAEKNQKFESLKLPHVKSETVSELAMAFLSSKLREKDAEAELKQMSEEERLIFVGEKSIAHQGCFGCHDIKGFEQAKPIGTELSEEGVKDVHKLDFGYVHLEHSRQAWFAQKLKEPRIFDKGKEKVYHEKLKMPQFDFTEAQIQSLTTFILSLQRAKIPPQMKKTLNLKEQQIEEGRLLVDKFNCQGCHTLDGKEGRIRQIVEDPGNAPPIINGEGKKVQSVWLYGFIRQPVTIRPWLKFRMPTFGFGHEDLRTVVEYFQNLEGVKPSYGEDQLHVDPSSPKTLAGKELFEKFQCIKCHKSNPAPGLTASFLAPNLVMAKKRLRPGWVVEWLKDPQAIQPGTMMPTFFADGQSPVPDILNGDSIAQSEAIRDYLWVFEGEDAAKDRMAEPAVASKA